MKKLLCATMALLVSMGIYKVSAQQADTTSSPNAMQMGTPPGDHRALPPNVTQAITLLDQAKQQSNSAVVSLIDQAETLLKQPPPHHGMGQMQGGGMGQGNIGQRQGPPPQ